jgi:hypothetical protein
VAECEPDAPQLKPDALSAIFAPSRTTDEIIGLRYGFVFRWPTGFGRDFLSLARYAFKRGFGVPLSSNVIHPPSGRGTHTSADDGFVFFIGCPLHGLA